MSKYFMGGSQCPYLGTFVQKLFFIQKAVNLSSKSLLALTIQVSTCFEDFMNISWFYLIKIIFSGHFWPYTLSAPSWTASWGYLWNANEIYVTYPESSWYKLLKNARKSWNNHKSYCTLLDNFGQKYSKTDAVPESIGLK